jgi:hypothetical protein
VRWWAWTSIGLAAALIAAALTYIVEVETAAPLEQDGASGWWFPQDGAHSSTIQSIEGTQMTTPERYRQQQGFLIGVDNNSDWTQTIEGIDPNFTVPMLPMTVSVDAGPGDENGNITPQTRWVLPAAIPPHSYRLIRVLFTANVCQDPGGSVGFISVPLRVRVGLITRTEVVPLVHEAFVITGTKASSHCP